MFTHKSIRWIIIFTLVTVLAAANYSLPSVALATGPDTVVPDANTYISYLDSLREMGQAEARLAQARHARDVAVFDHTSYLDRLHEQAFLVRISDRNRAVVSDANSYITYLDQLRGSTTGSRSDTGAYISYLDWLRQEGQTATINNSQVASR